MALVAEALVAAEAQSDGSPTLALTRNLRVAVLLPCYNEELTIASTVAAFQAALPGADIYVYDNNSRDRTIAIARETGAIVRTERRQGKGNVVRRMFADVEADVYIIADADNTYHAPSAVPMVEQLVAEKLDMVVASRASDEREAYRFGHRFGNTMLTGFVTWIFGDDVRDMLSGYRVFSRRFVKSFPALSSGFEIETELTVHALHLAMPIAERDAPYRSRPEGSTSKLSTYKDGFRILLTIVVLFKEEKPLLFFGIVSLALCLLSFGLGLPLLIEYYQTGLVPRFPTAILAAAVMVLAFLALACGFILDTVSRGRRELKRLQYLGLGAVPNAEP
jgi:glycosyltransferase involved in cell wall biosynthesis